MSHALPPAIQQLFFVVYLAFYLFAGFALWDLAKQSSTWLPTVGVVQDNTSHKRTIVYQVGKQRRQTDCENILNILENRYHVDLKYSRPGQSKAVFNGVDPQIGRRVTVYYDPKDTSKAVVLPGWSAPVVILGICTTIPLLLMAWVQLVGGWNVHGSNDYFDDPY
jgi:hypothetical protein